MIFHNHKRNYFHGKRNEGYLNLKHVQAPLNQVQNKLGYFLNKRNYSWYKHDDGNVLYIIGDV